MWLWMEDKTITEGVISLTMEFAPAYQLFMQRGGGFVVGIAWVWSLG